MISTWKPLLVPINVRSLMVRLKKDTSCRKMYLPAKEQLPGKSAESYAPEMHPDHPHGGGDFKDPLFLGDNRPQHTDYIIYPTFKNPGRPGLTNKAHMGEPSADLFSDSRSHPSPGNHGNT